MGQQVEATLRRELSTTDYEVIGFVSLKNYQQSSEVVSEVSVSVRVTAGSTLTGFRISERSHRNSFWVPSYDSSAQWTSPGANSGIINVKGTADPPDPTVLANGESVIFVLDRLKAIEGFQFEARIASGTATVEIAVGSDT